MLRLYRLWIYLLLVAGIEAVTFTSKPEILYSGTPFTITWTRSGTGNGLVSLYLILAINSNDRLTLLTIGNGIGGSSYNWTPPFGISSGHYLFEIADDNGSNYSAEFQIFGIKSSSSSTAVKTEVIATFTIINSLTTSILFSSSTSRISSSTQSTSTSSPQSGSADSLSASAKAAIGVGAALGVILISCLIIFAFWYSRRSTNKKKPVVDDTHGKAELDADDLPKELDAVPLEEEERVEEERRRSAAEAEGIVGGFANSATEVQGGPRG